VNRLADAASRRLSPCVANTSRMDSCRPAGQRCGDPQPTSRSTAAWNLSLKCSRKRSQGVLGVGEVKMRRHTRTAGGHRREGKAPCHGCEHPTQTKRPRRPAAGTEQLHQLEGKKSPFAGSAQDLPDQQERAGHPQIRLKRPARLLPPDAQPPKMPQPGLPAGRQATARSTTHHRGYRRSDRSSRLRFSGRRLLRCGAISSMPRAANARSRASLSQALSPTSRCGTSFVRMKSNHPCVRVDSCGRAEQLCTAMGNPRASTAMRIFTPLPTLVRPTPSPPPRAEQNAASRKHSYSRYPPRSSTSCPACCNSRSNTPSRTSRWKNRCTALLEPNSRGRSFHLALLSNNQKIPLVPCACRFGGGRPWGSW